MPCSLPLQAVSRHSTYATTSSQATRNVRTGTSFNQDFNPAAPSMTSVPFSFLENRRAGGYASTAQHYSHRGTNSHSAAHSTHSGSHAAQQLVEYQMYKSNSHSTGLLAGLNQCRLETQLCDVTLLAADQQFKAHRIVLASCSTFFKELFNTTVGLKLMDFYFCQKILNQL